MVYSGKKLAYQVKKKRVHAPLIMDRLKLIQSTREEIFYKSDYEESSLVTRRRNRQKMSF
jgi:hypothetical protein